MSGHGEEVGIVRGLMTAARGRCRLLAASVLGRDIAFALVLKVALIVALYLFLFRPALHPAQDPAATAAAVAGAAIATAHEGER